VRARSQTPKKRLVSDRVLNARCLWTSSRVVAGLAAKAFVSICVAIRPSSIDRRPEGVVERVVIGADPFRQRKCTRQNGATLDSDSGKWFCLPCYRTDRGFRGGDVSGAFFVRCSPGFEINSI
jgi:hypothetical protein